MGSERGWVKLGTYELNNVCNIYLRATDYLNPEGTVIADAVAWVPAR